MSQGLDEYHARSKETLDNLKWSGPGEKPSDLGIPLNQANRIFEVEEDSHGFLNGYSRLPDGTLYIATCTPFPNVTGEMFDWWLSRFLEDTERYKIWHSKDHVSSTWDDDYFKVPVMERKAGHFVGHSHIVKEYIGGWLFHLHIDFKPVETYLDVSRFKEAGGIACASARANMYHPVAGDVATGHLIHFLKENKATGEIELRSHFWIGQVDHNAGGWLPSFVVKFFGNTKMFRFLLAPSSLGRDLHKHCYEEMSCLAAVLPQLYVAFSDKPSVPLS